MKFSINKSVFNHIISSPNYIKNKDLTLIYSLYDNNCLGFIVPRQLGSARDRNLLKRRCRDVFSTMCKNDLKSPVGVIIKPQTINIDYSQISNIFFKLSNCLLEN